jgi:Protein of unknown function (DUF2690)
MNLAPFLEAITSVTGPLTLIAFIVASLLAALIVVLKSTGGLSKAQEFLLKDASLGKGEFVKIVNSVLWTLLVIAGMLFALLAYNFHIDRQKAEQETGLACYAEKCTGRDPKNAGCDIGVATITSTVASFPEFGEDFRNIKVEMRHSERCNASWVKAKAPVGSTLYLEGKNGEKYVSSTILDDGITAPHYSDMGPGNVERRACVQAPTPNSTSECTKFIN